MNAGRPNQSSSTVSNRVVSTDYLRRRIAWETAKLLYSSLDPEYFSAKRSVARRITMNRVHPRNLPSNREIREQIEILAGMHALHRRRERLASMRRAAFDLMQFLRDFRPRLVGSVLSGEIRPESEIDIHLFSDDVESVLSALEDSGDVDYRVDEKKVEKQGEDRVFTHVRFFNSYPFDLAVHPFSDEGRRFRSPTTGQPIDRADIEQVEQLLRESPVPPPHDAAFIASPPAPPSRFEVYESLLLPLESVRQPAKFHPEGDALYHSLQVFELARDRLPYDEEFITAALLHDVGKAIDPRDHVAAGLEALEETITPRTAWLIKHHEEAVFLQQGTLGQRARRRLEQSEDYDELLALAECDLEGRRVGVPVCDVEEALSFIRDLDAEDESL